MVIIKGDARSSILLVTGTWFGLDSVMLKSDQRLKWFDKRCLRRLQWHNHDNIYWFSPSNSYWADFVSVELSVQKIPYYQSNSKIIFERLILCRIGFNNKFIMRCQTITLLKENSAFREISEWFGKVGVYIKYHAKSNWIALYYI